MGAGQSKVVSIHIPVGEGKIRSRKAKRQWRKNFRLLSLLCCSSTRPASASPVATKIPATPPLYEHPYMVTESDIETISLTSIPPPPMTVSDHCLTPDSEQDAELGAVQSNDPEMPNVCNHQQPKPRNRVVLPPLPDPGRSNPTPNHPKNKKKKKKRKQKSLKVDGSETNVQRCKTSVKKNRATKLRESEAAATGPPSVRIPTPYPKETRTSITRRIPRRHTATIRSQNAADSHTVDSARDSPVTSTRNVSPSSSLISEILLDEVHSPHDSQVLPLRDSFDSLDSDTHVSKPAGPNTDDLSDEDEDDSKPKPRDNKTSKSSTKSDTVSNIPRPRASYGTVLLERKEGWLSSAPRVLSSIKCRRSNNMTEAQVRRSQCDDMVVADVDDDDKVEKREPRRNRLLTAIRRLRGNTNSTRVSETSTAVEASTSATVQVAEASSHSQVTEISGQTEVAEISGQTEVAEPRRRARRLVLRPMDQQPHPFSVGFEGWRYDVR